MWKVYRGLLTIASGFLLLVSANGCQRMGQQMSRKLFGEDESHKKTEYVDRYVNVWTTEGKVLSDHFVVSSGDFSKPGVAVLVELYNSNMASVPLPIQDPKTSVTATWLRQDSFISIYNAQAVLPQFGYYRITVIDGLNVTS